MYLYMYCVIAAIHDPANACLGMVTWGIPTGLGSGYMGNTHRCARLGMVTWGIPTVVVLHIWAVHGTEWG